MPLRMTQARVVALPTEPDASHAGVESVDVVVGLADVGLDVGDAVGIRVDGMPVVGLADVGLPLVGLADVGVPLVGLVDDGSLVGLADEGLADVGVLVGLADVGLAVGLPDVGVVVGLDVVGLDVGLDDDGLPVGLAVVGLAVVGLDVGLDDDGLPVGTRLGLDVGLDVGSYVNGNVLVSGLLPSSILCASPVKRKYQSLGRSIPSASNPNHPFVGNGKSALRGVTLNIAVPSSTSSNCAVNIVLTSAFDAYSCA